MYLSGSRVSSIREMYNAGGNSDLVSFIQKEGIKITPVKNDLLSKAELLVIEIDDRTIVNGLTTVSPADEEILSMMWENWLIESGVPRKNLEIIATASSPQKIEKILETFLEINK
jgi:hypothetical protein